MKQIIRILFVTALTLGLVGPMLAEDIVKAVLDANGARPQAFRLSCRKVDGGYLLPDILKRSIVNPSGLHYLNAHGLAVGKQDGQYVLFDNCYQDDAQKTIIGDASDLNDIRLLPGVTLTVVYSKNYGPISNMFAPAPNYLSMNVDFAADFVGRKFTGDEMDPKAITEGLIEAIQKGDGENVKTLLAVCKARWEGYSWESMKNYCAALPKDHVERIRVSYCEPMTQAASSLDGKLRRTLVDCHEDILAAGHRYMQKCIKKEGEDDSEVVMLRKVLAELAGLDF